MELERALKTKGLSANEMEKESSSEAAEFPTVYWYRAAQGRDQQAIQMKERS